ncbi:MAG: hybrid sensor histidine kinase/response regulator [Actinomycetota bacterium]
MSELSDDLLAELMATFYVEARDRLDAASRQLLILEETTDPTRRADLVAEIFREVHSLKGASAAVGLEGIRDLSHSLETLFERAREGETLDPSAFDVVYEALDAIESLVQDAASGEASGLDTTQIIVRLENAAGDLGTVPDRGGAESRLGPRRLDEQTSAPTTPVPAVAPAAVEGAARPADDTIRVSTAKLDALMAQVGELLVTTIGTERRLADAARLVELSGRADTAWREARTIYRRLLSDLTGGQGQASTGELSSLLDFVQHSDELGQQIFRGAADLERKLAADGRRLSQVVSELQDDVRRTRMLPVSTLFSALPRLVRDVARELGKDSVLMVEGGETEVDRSVLEQLRAPMNHLLRNAVDHGLETPEVRRATGKPARGTIKVSAHQRGDSLVVEIADDGAGIDAGVVRASAVKRGLVTAAEAESMGDAGVLDLIFRSGVSTSPMITDLSGRGVGLDVVRDAIERMHGILEVHTEPGAGTTFVLSVPLAVATIQCLLVRSGEANFAIPATNVVRVLRLDPGRIGHADGRETIVVDGRPVPVSHLDDVLGLPRTSDPEPTTKLPVIVLGSVDKRVALIAPGLLGAQEVVIKGLPPPLVRVRNIAGAGIMGTGEIVLVLNNGDLTRSADRANVQGDMATPREEANTGAAVVLVADDSIVTRTLEKNILESAGFRVRVAADGVEAWDVLQSGGVHLLVADVEMPRLDGFDLTERVRCDRRLRDLPVVLVTSMDSHEHRRRGVAVGADAHIIKQSFNQEVLLDTIRRLI